MIANLASLAIMIAALLFMLSLPFKDSEAARSLRRGAAFAFAMAFVPSIVIYIFEPIAKNLRSGTGVQSFLAICGALAILGLFAFAAYGFLDARSRMRSRQPKPHAEHGYTKRRPAEHSDHEEAHE
jgi:hypothetical protein